MTSRVRRVVETPGRRLQRQLAENARIATDVWTKPTVAEEFGLNLPLSAWAEFRSGDADATD